MIKHFSCTVDTKPRRYIYGLRDSGYDLNRIAITEGFSVSIGNDISWTQVDSCQAKCGPMAHSTVNKLTNIKMFFSERVKLLTGYLCVLTRMRLIIFFSYINGLCGSVNTRVSCNLNLMLNNFSTCCTLVNGWPPPLRRSPLSQSYLSRMITDLLMAFSHIFVMAGAEYNKNNTLVAKAKDF